VWAIYKYIYVYTLEVIQNTGCAMTLAFSRRVPTAKSRVLQQIIRLGWFYVGQSFV